MTNWEAAPANVREWFEDHLGTHQATDAATSAVYRILDLHAPEVFRGRVFCQHCLANDGEQEYYPCRTIQMVSEGIRTQSPSFVLSANRGEA